MSDPDMFLNYTPTSAVSGAGKQAQLGGTARHAFPDSVHVPEGVDYQPAVCTNICLVQLTWSHVVASGGFSVFRCCVSLVCPSKVHAHQQILNLFRASMLGTRLA